MGSGCLAGSLQGTQSSPELPPTSLRVQGETPEGGEKLGQPAQAEEGRGRPPMPLCMAPGSKHAACGWAGELVWAQVAAASLPPNLPPCAGLLCGCGKLHARLWRCGLAGHGVLGHGGMAHGHLGSGPLQGGAGAGQCKGHPRPVLYITGPLLELLEQVMAWGAQAVR